MFLGKILSNCYVHNILRAWVTSLLPPNRCCAQTSTICPSAEDYGEVCIYYRHKWNRLSIEAPVQCQVRNCRYHPSIFVFVTFPVLLSQELGFFFARRNSRDRRSSGSSQSRRQGPQHRTLATKLRQIVLTPGASCLLDYSEILPFHWKRLRFLQVLLKLSLQCIL